MFPVEQAELGQGYYTVAQVADICSVTKETVRRWHSSGKLVPERNPKNNYRMYSHEQLMLFDEAQGMLNSVWDEEFTISPLRQYKSIELFAGGGGLALGMEQCGFQAILLNEWDKDACATLRKNRPQWNVVEGDISKVDFKQYAGSIDFLSGGFPCQAFSYAGKKLGMEDTRGTLFYEFARALKEIQPSVFLAENVRGLLTHDDGRTLTAITHVFKELGYEIIPPQVLKAIFYKVPQKRERLFIVGVKRGFKASKHWKWPSHYHRVLTMKDALKAGELYPDNVPLSDGQEYPKRKKEILAMVPPGGYWRDLPIEIQKEYMKKSFYLGGGKTGMARRLSWDEPSLTLTCAPAQKQTERCHPDETRPLTVREYARIQTFPDDWEFCGSQTSRYKQIGNAVPVNLAAAVGRSIVKLLNFIEQEKV